MASDKKSPLKDNPLRNPGQSLDEAIDKTLNDEALGYIVAPIFFIVIAILEWWRWYVKSPYTPWTYTIIVLFVSTFCIIKLFKIRKKIINLRLGRDGERVVGQYLEGLRENGYKVFHDIVGNMFNIDHVIISEHGIFVVETKTYSKPNHGSANIVYDGFNISINGLKPLSDILIQARAEANWLQNMLKESSGKDVIIKPIIVFPGWNVDNKQAGFNPEVWVINPKALRAFIPKSGMSLSKEDVALHSYNISRYIRSTYSLE